MTSLVVFDCDGVLVDSEGIANRSLAEALARWGLPLSVAEVRRRWLGRSLNAFAEDLAGQLPDGWREELQAQDFDRLRASLQPVPHARETVERLLALGYATCVASSGSPEKLALTLGVTGLAPLFGDRVFSAHQVARGKPAPDLFQFAAARMGTPPERCVVVEDSVPGVQGAVAAGMRVFGYAGDPETDATGLAAAGATLLHDLRELPDRLQSSQTSANPSG